MVKNRPPDNAILAILFRTVLSNEMNWDLMNVYFNIMEICTVTKISIMLNRNASF